MLCIWYNITLLPHLKWFDMMTRADCLSDGCWNHSLEIGHGGSRRCQSYGYEESCRYDSEFGSK